MAVEPLSQKPGSEAWHESTVALLRRRGKGGRWLCGCRPRSNAWQHQAKGGRSIRGPAAEMHQVHDGIVSTVRDEWLPQVTAVQSAM